MNQNINKNRLLRLQILDSLLSESMKGYSIKQLVTYISEKSGQETNRYAINRDIEFIKNQLGVEIDAISYKEEVGKFRKKVDVIYYRYHNSNFSIFKVSLSDEERNFLSECLNMLGLKGVTSLRFFRKLELTTTKPNYIISFTKNPIEQSISIILSDINLAIKHKEVITFKLKKRRPTQEDVKVIVHPWYLREYNRRWYLFGLDERDETIKKFALDRVIPPIKQPKKTIIYKSAPISIDNILKDTIGVSLVDSEPLEIVFWVSPNSSDYVCSKPLHTSQTKVNIESYPQFTEFAKKNEGMFFRIYAKNNYELIRELMSFGPDLIVLSPYEIINKIKSTILEMSMKYNS